MRLHQLTETDDEYDNLNQTDNQEYLALTINNQRLTITYQKYSPTFDAVEAFFA